MGYLEPQGLVQARQPNPDLQTLRPKWDFPKIRVIPYLGSVFQRSYYLGYYIRGPIFRKPPNPLTPEAREPSMPLRHSMSNAVWKATRTLESSIRNIPGQKTHGNLQLRISPCCGHIWSYGVLYNWGSLWRYKLYVSLGFCT